MEDDLPVIRVVYFWKDDKVYLASMDGKRKVLLPDDLAQEVVALTKGHVQVDQGSVTEGNGNGGR